MAREDQRRPQSGSLVPTFPVIPYELRLNVLSAAPLALVRLAKPKVVISTHSLDG